MRDEKMTCKCLNYTIVMTEDESKLIKSPNLVLVYFSNSQIISVCLNYLYLSYKYHRFRIKIANAKKLKSTNFSSGRGYIFFYLVNNCKVIISEEIFKIISNKQNYLLYGDSLIKYKLKSKLNFWYESRPIFSRIFLNSHFYLGDLIISDLIFNTRNDIYSLVLRLPENLEVSRISQGISYRKSNLVDSNGIPILKNNYDFYNTAINHNFLKNQSFFSIIIPTKFSMSLNFNILNLINNLSQMSSNAKFEIILAFNNQNINHFNSMMCKVKNKTLIVPFQYDYDFNFSKVMNQCSKIAKSSKLIFMNDDILFDEKIDFFNFLSHLDDVKVGAVGIRLLNSSKKLDHAGIEFKNSQPEHFLIGSQFDYMIDAHRHCREVSGVTGAFFAIEKSKFELVNGFDEKFPNDFNDIDLMLRLNDIGLLNVLCSKVIATHFVSMTRGISNSDKLLGDLNKLKQKHKTLPNRDSYLYTPAVRL